MLYAAQSSPQIDTATAEKGRFRMKSKVIVSGTEPSREDAVIIRFMTEDDLPQAALIHQEAFVRQQLSYEWLACNLRAYPRFLCFVAETDDAISGYIIWVQKSGFRPQVVLELEQVAVSSQQQGQGIGRELIEKSLPLVQDQLSKRNATLKHIMVTTRADNKAQQLYHKTLGATVEATIANLYSADEVLMVARDVRVDDHVRGNATL